MRIPGASPALLHSVSLTAAFLTITTLHIVLGEQAPKWLGIRNPEGVALWVAMPLWAFHKLTYPLTWLLNKATNGVLQLIGIGPDGNPNGSHRGGAAAGCSARAPAAGFRSRSAS